MNVSRILMIALGLTTLALPACDNREAHAEHEEHKIVVTEVKVKDVVLTEPYVCQIHSRRHIAICALSGGYLQSILVKEGQAVKKGDVMFKILPVLYKAKWDAEIAEANLAALELQYSKGLAGNNVVSPKEVPLYKAKLTRAEAKARLAEAEYNFCTITAPFDGIMDRLERREGSLIKEGEELTTLSDNSVMWVYFNVPEARYLDYMANRGKDKANERIELKLADGTIFPEPGKIGAIEAKFNNETGNIPFRADFDNPDRLLRHGQTGTILLHKTAKDSIVIPQRSTIEILDQRYVFVLGDDNKVHQRRVIVLNELDDVFLIAKYDDDGKGKKGLKLDEQFVLEGVRQISDGQEVKEHEYIKPDVALSQSHLKYHAE